MKRNLSRFPKDFAFQLTETEANNLRFQSGTSSWGGNRYLPFVFTEQGIAMLSSVLRSRQAIQVNVEIMRAFVRLRKIIATNEDLSRRLNELEKRHEGKFKVVFEVIRSLMSEAEKPKPRIGFKSK
ncbi:MAG: DNA-binding protein [Elusimicrobia bacterium]|nr:MAG: DNA-binding protein [Elusimicrobiota bacterium]